MQFKIFNNQILVPLKCGSTYMEMVYPENIIDVSYTNLPQFKDVTAIIIRDPFDHLQSALHTEILMECWEFNKLLSIETVIPIIKKFINTDLNPRGSTHWDVNYYENLYKFWKRNRNTIKIIHISELSSFLKENYDVDLIHDKFSYGIPALVANFKYKFTSKQKLSKWIEETLPDMWNNLIRDIPKADKFYNLMINGEISEIYELEEQIMELEAQITELKTKVDKLEKFIYGITPSTKKKII